MKFNFPNNLIKRYNRTFQILQGSESGSYNTTTGKWEKSEVVEVLAKGCIVPYPKNVVYQSGGSILTTDRQIITTSFVPLNCQIKYKDELYTIQEMTSYDEYSMFYTYQARRVDAYD